MWSMGVGIERSVCFCNAWRPVVFRLLQVYSMFLGQFIPFDPQQHITAGQLRRLGFLLCEIIPDEAFVRRIAVSVADEYIEEPAATLGLALREPFRGLVELAA